MPTLSIAFSTPMLSLSPFRTFLIRILIRTQKEMEKSGVGMDERRKTLSPFIQDPVLGPGPKQGHHLV